MVYLFVVIQIYNKFSGFLLFFTIIYNLSLEMSDEPNLLLRIKAVQALDQLYYQKGEHLYSHRRVWRNHARRIFGINYTTYASYLRRDVSHLPDQPEVAETVRRLDEILNK